MNQLLNTYRRIRDVIGTGGIKVLFLVIIFVSVLFLVNLTGAFFWTIFFLFLLFKIDSKYVGQAALLCLVLLPFLLALGKEAVAEQVAVYAFFLLVITVALQMVELKRDEKKSEDSSEEPPSEATPLNTEMKKGRIVDLRRARKFMLDLRASDTWPI